VNWLTLKTKLIALGDIALSVIAFFLRFKQVKRQRDKARHQADKAEAELEFRDDVDEMETELDSNYQPHRADIVNADKDETFDVLSDPDSIRMRDKST